MYSGFFHAGKENQMDRNVNVITDLNGKKVVVINDIYFYGKQHIKWDDVEQYFLKKNQRHWLMHQVLNF